MKKENLLVTMTIISYVTWTIAWILISLFFGWTMFLVLFFYGIGLSGIIIWIIIIPELNKLKNEINELKKGKND